MTDKNLNLSENSRQIVTKYTTEKETYKYTFIIKKKEKHNLIIFFKRSIRD